MPPLDAIPCGSILLSSIAMQHVPDLHHACWSVREVMQYENFALHSELQHSVARVEALAEQWASQEELVYALVHQGSAIGTVALGKRASGFNVSYALARPYWGQGMARAAVVAALQEAERLHPAGEMVAACHTDNLRSVQLLSSLHFERHGVFVDSSAFPNLEGDAPRTFGVYIRMADVACGA